MPSLRTHLEATRGLCALSVLVGNLLAYAGAHPMAISTSKLRRIRSARIFTETR